MEWLHSWCSACWEAQHKAQAAPFCVPGESLQLWLTLSASTQENKATRTGSLPFRNGQTGYSPRDDYTDPWSTNLASYLLDGLPVSGIAEDKRDCWESKLLGFFPPLFLWKDVVWDLALAWSCFSCINFQSFLHPRNNKGWVAHCATVDKEDCVELLKSDCGVSAEDSQPGFGALHRYLCVARNSPGTGLWLEQNLLVEGGQ